MAKRRGNTSAAIREYKAKHPEATGPEIANAVKSSLPLVYSVLNRANGKKSKKASKHNGNGFSLDDMLAVKQLASKLGSLDAVKSAVNALEKLAV